MGRPPTRRQPRNHDGTLNPGTVARRRTVMEAMLEGRPRSGEAAEFAAWVQPHLAAMSRLAARLVPTSDIDDVVQEALVRAWRRRSTYDAARGSANAWLLAIVADRARRHRTRARSHLELVDSSVEQGSRDLDLERAIDALPARQRMAVNLYYFVGLDISTCAAVMGCAEGTVKATLHQARAGMRVQLGDDFTGSAR
jgi:RNA polymerase sigma factor (sigma-70 family)